MPWCAAAPSEDRTVLLASHELEHARALADREVVITAGQARGSRPGADVTDRRRSSHEPLA